MPDKQKEIDVKIVEVQKKASEAVSSERNR